MTWSSFRSAGLIVCALASSAQGAPIAIVNQGFESQVLAAGDFTFDPPTLTPGWTHIPLAAQGGVIYPTLESWGYGAPEGHQTLWCNSNIGQVMFEQTVAATAQPSRTYTLRVAVVHRPSFFNNDYIIQLLAGATVVAENLGTVSPPPGGSADAVLVYASPASGPTIGQPLTIRLGGATQANFDDVRLDDDAPAPCPGDITGDGATNSADFNVLASNFGDGPGATHAEGDLSGDGFVNSADFNILAGDFGCGG